MQLSQQDERKLMQELAADAERFIKWYCLCCVPVFSTMLLLQPCSKASLMHCRGIRTSKQQCTQCQCVLPTRYLLSIHVSEQHDSFFASQAAHRMPVFQCLVEGCATTFTSVGQRHQHLTDLHQIASDSGFDRYADTGL